MPSLSPGTPGAKEAYGIAILRENREIVIPPKAFSRYKLDDNEPVLLTTTRTGENGFTVLNFEMARQSVFKEIIDKIAVVDKPFMVKSRPYALTRTHNKKIIFNDELLNAFNLKPGERFIVIKSTTVSMSFTPVEIWKRKFEKRGFVEAIKNMEELEVF